MPRKKAVRKCSADEVRQQKLKSLLKQYDMEVKRRLYEMRRKTEEAVSSIDGIFKLAQFRMPSAVKIQLWNNNGRLPVEVAAVDEMIKAAKASQKKRSARRARGRPAEEQLATPLQLSQPLYASTPAVAPKFDPLTVRQVAPSTIRRQRPHELVMSLKGSPVQGDGVMTVQPLRSVLQATADKLTEVMSPDELEEDTKEMLALLQDRLNRLVPALSE